MSPSSTVHGGLYDTKYVTFELLLHTAFVADEIWGYCLNQLVAIQSKRALRFPRISVTYAEVALQPNRKSGVGRTWKQVEHCLHPSVNLDHNHNLI